MLFSSLNQTGNRNTAKTSENRPLSDGCFKLQTLIRWWFCAECGVISCVHYHLSCGNVKEKCYFIITSTIRQIMCVYHFKMIDGGPRSHHHEKLIWWILRNSDSVWTMFCSEILYHNRLLFFLYCMAAHVETQEKMAKPRKYKYRKNSKISRTKSQNFNVFRLVLQLTFSTHWSQVLNRECRCSWTSADTGRTQAFFRPHSSYIWVINNFIAY